MRLREVFSEKKVWLVVFVLTIAFFNLSPTKIFAASLTWTGIAGDSLWSTGGNWSSGSKPTSSDSATFDNTCTNCAVTMDEDTTVTGFTVASTYANTITQNAGTDIIVNGTFSVAGGIFEGSDTTGTITVNGSFTQSGGAVTSTAATLSVRADMNLSSGTFTHNSGTVAFFDTTFGQDSTLTCSGAPFNLITITKDQGGSTFFQNDFILSANCTAPLGASPTTTLSSTAQPTFTNNGTITISSGTWTMAGYPAFSNNGTVTHSGTGWVFGGSFANTSNGSVTYSGTTASFSGNLNIASGTFPSGLTVTFLDTGSFQDSIITCAGSPFNQVIITKDQGGATFGENDVTISSNCTVPLGASPTTTIATSSGPNAALVNNGTITITSGTWAMTGNHTFTNNGTVTHSGNGWTTQGAFVNSSSGVVTYSGTTMTVRWNMNVSSGTFPSGIALTYNDSGGAANATFTCGSVTWSSLTVSKTGPSTLTPGSSCTITGDFSNTAGTVGNPSSAYTYTVQGNFSKSASTTFGGANLTLELAGGTDTTVSHSAGTFSAKYKVNKSVGNKVTQTTNLTLGNTFDVTSGTHDQGATFNLTTGGATTIDTDGTWINTGTGDITLAGDVTNSGAITLDGSGVGCGGADAIVIASSAGQRTWSGSGSISPVYDVSVSNQGGSITAISSTDTSGNGWTFISSCNADPNVPSSLGPAGYVDGSWTTDNTPTLTFSLSDSDGSDTVKYQIQIDDTAGFGSVVVDYTSALAAQGSFSFTVGQVAGGGSYTTGSGGQTLSDSSGYYWRVKTIDNSAAESAYSTANSGGIAFKVDATPPTAGAVTLSDMTTESITSTVAGASDAMSGLTASPYLFQNITNSTDSGQTALTSWESTGLSSGEQYSFNAVVTDIAGNTAATATVTESTENPPPSSSGSSRGAGQKKSTPEFKWPKFDLPFLGENDKEEKPVKPQKPSAVEEPVTSPPVETAPPEAPLEPEVPVIEETITAEEPQNILEEITEAVVDAADTVQEAVQEIVETVVEMVETIPEAIVAVAQNISYTVASATESFTSFITSTLPSYAERSVRFVSSVGSRPITENVRLVVSGVKEVTEEPVVKTIGTAAVAAPAAAGAAVILTPAVAAGVPIANQFSYLMIFTAQLLGLRKKPKPWGTVYDVASKQPIPFARVEILNKNGRRLDSTVTDQFGRYGFLIASSLPSQGGVALRASQANYVFPGVSQHSDLEKLIYPNAYRGGLVEAKGIANFDLPLEPAEKPSGSFYPRFLSKNINNILVPIINALFTVGAIFALTLFSVNPGLVAGVLLVLITATTLLKKSGFGLKPFGLTEDILRGQIMPFSFIAVHNKDGQRINFTVSDDQGRYFMLVPQGTYQIQAHTPAHINPPRDKELYLKTKKGWVSKEIKL